MCYRVDGRTQGLCYIRAPGTEEMRADTDKDTPRERQLGRQEAVAYPRRAEGAREDDAIETATHRKEVSGR